MLTAKFSTLPQMVADIEAERDKLRAFAIDVLRDWPDEGGPDGGWLQVMAIEHGLLKAHEPKPTYPCGKACNCAEYYSATEWKAGIVCYRRTALLKGTA